MEEDRAANQRSAFSLSFTLALYVSNGFGLSLFINISLKFGQRDGLQVNVDHKMLCFSALTPECKNPKQREIEMLKLQRGLGLVNDDGSIWFPHVPDPDADGPINDEEEEV